MRRRRIETKKMIHGGKDDRKEDKRKEKGRKL